MRAIFICREPRKGEFLSEPAVGAIPRVWPADRSVPRGWVQVEPELGDQARAALLKTIREWHEEPAQAELTVACARRFYLPGGCGVYIQCALLTGHKAKHAFAWDD